MLRFRGLHLKGFAYSTVLLAVIANPTIAASVTGTVLGPDDKPVAGAQVTTQIWVGQSHTTELQTDAAGKFTFDATFTKPTQAVARVVIVAPGLALGGGIIYGKDKVFHLGRAGAVTGQVVDAKGQPVAGVRVRLSGIQPQNQRDYAQDVWLNSEALQSKFTATTDATGHWAIQGVPSSGKASISLDDPAYVTAQQQVPLNPETPPPPLVVRPGATLMGRVVFEDGKPAPGVEVFAQGQRTVEGWAEGMSDANGVYKLPGLPTGRYNVMADAEQKFKAVVAPALEGVTAQEGKELKIADLVLGSGALVEGTVVNNATDKPLPDVSVGSYGPHRPRSSAAIINALTDAQGHYQLRVAPGKSSIYLQGVPTGYLRPEGTNEGMTEVELTKGQTTTLPFRVSRGLIATGSAVDAAGKPVSGVTIVLGEQWAELSGLTDANGQWSIEGLKPSDYQLSTDAEWQIVTPDKISLPAFAPIKVTVRKLTLTPLQARVVDTGGKPVAGALIKAEIYTPVTPESGSSREEQLFSDAAGHVELTKLRQNETVTLATEKNGYKYVAGGTVTKKDAAWSVSDIVLLALTAQREGQVLDAAGHPVAGAQVFSPDGGLAAPIVTDANGKFTLGDLPPGAVTIMAAQGSGFAQLRAPAVATAVTLTLAPLPPPAPLDIPRATTIIQDVYKQAEGKDFFARDWLPLTLAPYAPTVAIQLQPHANVPMRHDTAAEEKKMQLIHVLAEVNPDFAGAWVPDQLDTLQSTQHKLVAATLVGLAVVHTNPQLALQMLTRAKTWADEPPAKAAAQPDDQDFWHLSTQVDLAALEAQFQDPTAIQRLGVALMVARNTYTETTQPPLSVILEGLASRAAEGGAAFVEQVTAQMAPAARVEALSRAIPIVAHYDAPGALRLLNEIEESHVTPEELKAPGGGSRLNGDPEYAFGIAAKPVIAALGLADPAAALALARRVKSSYHSPLALALAAQAQPKAIAGPLFLEAFAAAETDYHSDKARIAAMAFAVDPDLGRTLFADLKGQLVNRPNLANDGALPAFAFYYARVEPAASRLMLEAEHTRLWQTGKAAGWGLEGVALAMAAINVDRALEIARSMPGPDTNGRYDTQRKIAQYVVAPAAIRATMPYDRWHASDTWTPGTETGW